MNSTYKLINYSLLALIVFLIGFFYVFAKGINIVVMPLDAASKAQVTLINGLGFSFNERYIFLPGKKRLLIPIPLFIAKLTAIFFQILFDV